MLHHFKILRSANYRKYFAGQAISMVGTWMQSTIQAFLVYKISGQARWLGIIAFSTQVPAFVLSPLAGWVADHWERRKILLWVQITAMVQAIILTALVWTHQIQLWHFALLAIALGGINAFDSTTRQAFVVDIAPREALSSAISLNSTLMNGSRIIGPAIAGLLVESVGEQWCFFFNAASYLPVIYWLITMKLPRRHFSKDERTHPFLEIREGLAYTKNSHQISALLFVSAFISLLGAPFLTLLPVITRIQVGGGARELGYLSAAAGIGAVLGALRTVPQRKLRYDRLRYLRHNLLYLGAAFIAIATARVLPLALIALVFSGYFFMSSFPAINNWIQLEVREEMRGRVLSLYTMTFLGASPLSAIASGWLADRFSLGSVFGGLAVACVCVSLVVRSVFRQENPLQSIT